MKMKANKKVSSLPLAFAMALSITACGSQAVETTQSVEPTGSTQSAETTESTVPVSSGIQAQELGSGNPKWTETKTSDGWMEVTNEGGVTLGYSPDSGLSLIQVDGFAFKDLNGNGELDVYEDWRNDDATRARDLADKLSVEEMIPLFLHGGWMSFGATIDGTDLEYIEAGGRAGVTRSAANTGNTGMAVEWTNALQALCEGTGNWGIPATVSVDPCNISNTIDQLSLASTFDPDVAFELGVAHGKMYRAVGITMLLGPQIDIVTTPVLARTSGTYGEDPALSRDIADAYISGLQSTWADDGTDLGWGSDSVYAIAKHFVGAGAAEGGRNDHGDTGKYDVFPGENFAAHLIPFADGAFNLTRSITGTAGCMPNYAISYSRDGSLGELVGGAYSAYKLNYLWDNDWQGYIVTDFGIVTDGSEPFGVEDLTVGERFAKLLINGNHSIGGSSDVAGATEGYELAVDEIGEEAATAKLRELSYRFVLMQMELELFDNAYITSDNAFAQNYNADTDALSLEMQEKGIIMLKNTDNVISAADDSAEKATVYVPYVFTPGSGATGEEAEAAASSGGSTTASWDPVMNLDSVAKYYNVVTDTLLDPSGTPDAEGNPTYTEEDIVRATTDELASCTLAIVTMDAPSTDSATDADGKYLPASLQYGEYTATTARRESIAGGVTTESINDGYYGTKTQDVKENRSYYNNTVGKDANYADLELLQYVKETVPTSCKIVVLMASGKPMVWSEVEPLADAIFVYYGSSGFNGSWFFADALLNVVSGKTEPSGLLTLQQPISMEATEDQDEDVPRDVECYVDANGNTYDFAFGLNWSGVINDDRVATYNVPALTTPENWEFHYAE
jgi:beta-glucosidase